MSKTNKTWIMSVIQALGIKTASRILFSLMNLNLEKKICFHQSTAIITLLETLKNLFAYKKSAKI